MKQRGMAIFLGTLLAVPSPLKEHGYATAAVGKWHLGLGWQLKNGQPLPHEDQIPEDPGIDYTKPIQGGPLALDFDCFFGISASLDMDDDVGEKNNLYDRRPDIVKKLTALLEKYKRQGYSRP